MGYTSQAQHKPLARGNKTLNDYYYYLYYLWLDGKKFVTNKTHAVVRKGIAFVLVG
jgi:hypothetical protein